MRLSKYLAFIGFLFICAYSNSAFSQQRDPDLVQFSGIIVTTDNLQPIPYCDILIRNAHRGTISDYNGYFSFVAKKGDIIDFTALGFKKSSYTIPDSLTRDHYSLIQVMSSDTLLLSEAIVYPWPSVEQFKEAFIHLQIPYDDLTIAQKNLERKDLARRENAMPMDGSMNFRYHVDKQTAKLYYAGQLPPNNLLNPFAWAQFIKAWRDGKFKNNKD